MNFGSKKTTEPNSFKTLIDSFILKIKNHTNNDFDYIACQGVSGAILAGPLSLAIDKPLLIIKKYEEKSHRETKVTGHIDRFKENYSYIIVDDMICSGATISNIYSLIKDEFKTKHVGCKGIFLHDTTGFGQQYSCCGIRCYYI